jgi:hypothetical protein
VIDLGEGNQISLEETKTRFALKNDINQIQNLNQIISDINTLLKDTSQPLDPYLAYKIIYNIPKAGKPTLQIKPLQEGKMYQIESERKNVIPAKINPDSVIIQYDSFALKLTVKNLSELQKLETRPLDGYLNALKKDFESLPNKYHKNYVEMEYKAENNNLERKKSRLIRTDYIEISPGAGLGISRDRIVPSSYLDVKLVLADKIFFGARADLQFLFEKNEERKYSVLQNTFLGGEIGFKLRNGNGFFAPGWLSVGFDKLVNRTGNFYDENTYRASLHIPVAKSRIKLSPQWYFSNKGSGFLGFKLGMGF